MSAPIGGSTSNPVSVSRPQFLGLLHARMVDRLADPAVLHDVLQNHRSTVPDSHFTSDRPLREAVRAYLQRPAAIMAFFEMAQREPTDRSITAGLGLLGASMSFGSSLARAKLIELARRDGPAAPPAQEILRYSAVLRAAAALPYSLAFIVPLERMMRDLQARLARRNRQTDKGWKNYDLC